MLSGIVTTSQLQALLAAQPPMPQPPVAPFAVGDWVASPGGPGQILGVQPPTATVRLPLWGVAEPFPLTDLEPLAEGEPRPESPDALRDQGWSVKWQSQG